MTLYQLIRPALFALPPETIHRVVTQAGSAANGSPIERLCRHRYAVEDQRLAVQAFGQRFSNPIGVAAGFDKDGRMPSLLASLGFGHVEIGGVTAHQQRGNPRPRLFRLGEDDALINRMGFNNKGADRVATRLANTDPPKAPLGVNLGKSKGVPDQLAPEDYRYTYERLAPHGDFFVVNVSSPNTPGLRDLQRRDRLEAIVTDLQEAGADPLLIKLSPDVAEADAEGIVDLVEDSDMAGVIATNTTVDRPASLRSPHRAETGGLSGRPLAERSTRWIRFLARRTDVPIIGVGGVFTAHDAYRKIRAGASLVQLYTGLVYRGPGIARSINNGLLRYLERDGFTTVSDAVGADLI